jgi:hypothetical protein
VRGLILLKFQLFVFHITDTFSVASPRSPRFIRYSKQTNVVLQKPQGQGNRLPPPRTLSMDLTMTHVRVGRSHLHPMGQLTHTRRSDGAPDPDGDLKDTVRINIRHYHSVYLNRPDPIVVVPLTVDTTSRLYDDFIRLIFLYDHRESSALSNELPKELDQFCFLRVACFANMKGDVGLIMTKASGIRISIPSIPLDLSSRSS